MRADPRRKDTAGGIGGQVALLTNPSRGRYFPLGTYYTQATTVLHIAHREEHLMIVVTGATGNVGRPLVRALAAAGRASW